MQKTLLEDIFNTYYDTWFSVKVNNHKDESCIRFMELKHRGKNSFIKLFSYYPKTKKVSFVKLSSTNHLAWIVKVDIKKEEEDLLNSIFTKTLLMQNDGPTTGNIR